MDLHQQREQDLNEHIKKDLELQKKLEDQFRYEENEKEKEKLKNQIQEVKNSIVNYKSELNSLEFTEQDQVSLVSIMTTITFMELDMVTRGILCMPIPADSNFVVLPPGEKMLKLKKIQNLELQLEFLVL